MSVVGFQDFWVTGSRFYFQPDAVAGVEQALIDLGVIQTANPTIEPTSIDLQDGDGGVNTLVDQAITTIAESYDITVNNLNMDILSFLFLSSLPEAFTQAAEEKLVSHFATPSRLFKIKDDDVEATWLFNVANVIGVISALADLSTDPITAITVATKTVTTSADLTSDILPGDEIVIRETGLADITNAGTYTVATVTATNITTVEAIPGADEVAITGSMIYVDNVAGDTGTVYVKDTDWDVHQLERGVVRMIPGGAFAVAASVEVIYSMGALTGNRLLKPQSMPLVQGEGMLVWGRQDNVNQSVRNMRVSIVPSASAFSIDDFSNVVLSVTVLAELGVTLPEGRIIQFAGTLPTTS